MAAPSLRAMCARTGRLPMIRLFSPAVTVSNTCSRRFTMRTSARAQPATASTPASPRPPAPATPPAPTPAATAAAAAIPARSAAATTSASPLSKGFEDGLMLEAPLSADEQDWTRSYKGLGEAPFPPEVAEVLQAPLDPEDVEIKPDGILFLPEIKYRRILNKAFKPGGWGLAPRGETIVTAQSITREYGLIVNGRLVSIARGQQDYFNPEHIPMATEGCKSNAMMRCCKDLGIASELWDPRFIREFMKKHVKDIFVEHVVTKKKRKMYFRKDTDPTYPYKAC